MSTLISDVRYALRTWSRSRGYAAVAVVTLALGIGANTTMFSVISATVLRSLPFPEADRLITIWKSRIDEPNSRNITSWPTFRDWKERSGSFEQLATSRWPIACGPTRMRSASG